MAGLGRKVFTRETLASDEVNGYFMDQAVMRFASASARGVALPAPDEGMTTYRDDIEAIEVFTGAGYARLAEASSWVQLGAGAPNYVAAAQLNTPATLPAMSGSVTVPAGRILDARVQIPAVLVNASGEVVVRLLVNGVAQRSARVVTGPNGMIVPLSLACTVNGLSGSIPIAVQAHGIAGSGQVQGDQVTGPVLEYRLT